MNKILLTLYKRISRHSSVKFFFKNFISIVRQYLNVQDFTYFEKRIFSGDYHVGTPNLVVDCGAYVGDEIKKFQRLGNAEIVAIEPQPDCFEELVRKFSKDKRITLHNCALGDHVGAAKLYVNSNKQTSSLKAVASVDESWSEHFFNKTRIDVKLRTLDDLLKPSDDARIHLKLDVQGSELDILHGAHKLLDKKVISIMTECHFSQVYLGQPTFDQLYKLLHSFDFMLLGTFNPIYNSNGTLMQLDILWLKNIGS